MTGVKAYSSQVRCDEVNNMELKLAYDHGWIRMDVPSNVTIDEFRPASVKISQGENNLAACLDREEVRARIAGRSILIVVNDAYRATPTSKILMWLRRWDSTLLDRASFIVATGAHAAQSPEQLRMIFGELYDRIADRVILHDARDRSSMTRLGRDSLGGNVCVNTAVLRHESVIAIGSVEPHYFAGYTGGRKSIFPGLTDIETIERNHNLANSFNAAPLKCDGNPVAEHLDQLMAMLDPERFTGIQVVSDCRGGVAGLFVGSLGAAFKDAKHLCDRLYVRNVDSRYETVVCEVLPPLDCSLYQAQKSVENCQSAVMDGGKIVVVSACREGIGSDAFHDLALQWDRVANRPKDGRLRFGSHKLSRIISHARRIAVCIYSTLREDMVSQVFFEPVSDLRYFLTAGRAEGRIAIVHDAGNTVLRAG